VGIDRLRGSGPARRSAVAGGGTVAGARLTTGAAASDHRRPQSGTLPGAARGSTGARTLPAPDPDPESCWRTRRPLIPSRVLPAGGRGMRIDSELARAARDPAPLCAAVLDLDHFKSFNDQHGHRNGDHFLRRCSVVWKTKLRASDLLASYGGEEFALCLSKSPREPVEIVDRLRESTLRRADLLSRGGRMGWAGATRSTVRPRRQAAVRGQETGRDRTGSGPSSPPRRSAAMTIVN
jgi:hypothetical protein